MGLATPFSGPRFDELLLQIGNKSSRQLAEDEDFWARIRGGYRLTEEYINLENGYYCFMPDEILHHFIEHVKEVNYQGSHYMRTIQWENQKRIAAKLAQMAGCSEDELIISRNTTEALDLVIAGQDWKPGDEAVMAYQDYGAMLNQFKLMEKRYGIINRIISIPNHPKNDEEVVRLYELAINENTKLLMVCHIINITGQILPVKKICEMAHAKGVEVMVDGAHAFAHVEFAISDVGCDYYGTSLHKWLSVPLGAGFLYVNKKKISKLWPLFAEDERPEDDISRLNHLGTHPVHTHLAIENAIDYHNAIGTERKQARLKYLQNYWTSRVRDTPGITVNTPKEMARHGAIGNVAIDHLEPKDLADRLMNDYKIWTVAIDRPGVRGVRVTPNIYTNTDELDALVEALVALSKS